MMNRLLSLLHLLLNRGWKDETKTTTVLRKTSDLMKWSTVLEIVGCVVWVRIEAEKKKPVCETPFTICVTFDVLEERSVCVRVYVFLRWK